MDLDLGMLFVTLSLLQFHFVPVLKFGLGIDNRLFVAAYNHLYGSLISELGQLTQLKNLNLGTLCVTLSLLLFHFVLILNFRSGIDNRLFVADGNQLSGSLISELGQLTQLTYLGLGTLCVTLSLLLFNFVPTLKFRLGIDN
jgi:hypothetical protein